MNVENVAQAGVHPARLRGWFSKSSKKATRMLSASGGAPKKLVPWQESAQVDKVSDCFVPNLMSSWWKS